jgi:hypothetical protein
MLLIQATDKQDSRHGCRWLDAAFSDARQQYRAKSYIGAPRPMKMGTIRSPWCYDAALESTIVHPDARLG